VSTKHLPESLQNFNTKLMSITIPKNVEEVKRDPRWIQAMKLEMEALNKNDTWTLTKLPKKKKLVGYRWVYSIKFDANENIDRYKARLIIKEYTQTYGIDF
jgi:Reverse transcriptase (RNA-dependent DNA polymerase)